MAILPVGFSCGVGSARHGWKVLLPICAILISCIDGERGAQPTPIKATIRTEGGDVFDCVDIYKQPAFDHPLLKNHKIMMKPTVLFEGLGEEEEEEEEGREGSHANLPDYLRLKDGGCPLGTVPVHRLPNNGTNVSTRPTMPHTGLEQSDLDTFSHMWAIRQAREQIYYGASADINVYGVHPMNWEDVSGAVVWLINNNVSSPDQTSIIRAGWAVYPVGFKDYQTRLFVEWSSDNDRSGCINLQCPGFVQVRHDVALGNTIRPLSNYKAKPQYFIKVFMYKDFEDNWWFALHEKKKVVGYWPAELFQGRFVQASTIHYGGAVSCPKGKQCPPMGNGHNPRGGVTEMWNACFVQRVRAAYSDHTWDNLNVFDQTSVVSLPRCYNVGYYFFFHDVLYKFTFGGPFCPPA